MTWIADNDRQVLDWRIKPYIVFVDGSSPVNPGTGQTSFVSPAKARLAARKVPTVDIRRL